MTSRTFYNITPGTNTYLWGLVPYWAKDPKKGVRPVNAKAETAHEKPMFKKLIRERRCLIPANCYYEWKEMKGSSVVPKGSASGTKVQFPRVQELETLPDRDPDALEADPEPSKEATAPLSGQPAAGSERWVLDLQYQAKYQHAFGDA